MLSNFDHRELPRALQHLLAREPSRRSRQPLPRRSFLKLAGAGGLALGAFPLAAWRTGAARRRGLKPTQQPSAFVQIAAERRGHGHHQPARVRPGRADRPADDPGRGTRRRLEPGAQPARHRTTPPMSTRCSACTSPAAPTRSRTAYTQYRELGARARAMLLGRRGRAVEGGRGHACAREAGIVLGPGGRKLGYGELAEAAMALPVPEKVTLKDPKDFRLIGQPTGAARRARQDQRPPGLRHRRAPARQLTAVVAHPPVFGAKLASVDDSAARAVKGVKAVLRVPLDRGGEGVAVVADGYWPAKQGRDALKLRWDTAAVEKVDSERQLAQYRELADQPGPRKFDADMAPLATAPRQARSRVRLPLPGPRADGAAELHRRPCRRDAPSCGSARSARAWTPPRPRRCWASSPSR